MLDCLLDFVLHGAVVAAEELNAPLYVALCAVILQLEPAYHA